MTEAADARLAGSRWSFDDMRAWCEDNNYRPFSREMERWYYVETVDGPNGHGNQIQTLEGTDADAARKLLKGELGDFAGWTEERSDRYRSWLRSHIRRGLTNERYTTLMQGGLL